MTHSYDFPTVEARWRAHWAAIDLYKTGDDPSKPKHYILDFFPYPSGDGLSVGHCRNYVPTCVSSRFLRMNGYNVLHPMGWDAFGLPAENYAILHNVHPAVTTQRQVANYRRQLTLAECAYDWSREINSSDPEFYRWTQWFFLLLHERGLAYRALGRQWWCPQCQTILANEQVEDGCCWRCNSSVTKKELPQWYFRITAYADRLLADLDGLDWPEAIKQMQRNWIGRSEGAEVVFRSGDQEIPVFTTRPDTLFGVTFLALAPEHPLVAQLTSPDQQAAMAGYLAQAQQQSDIERLATERAKSGIFTGAYATHPLTGAALPIWVADYVLPGYGSGAVMGVPGHDTRDFAFAQTYELPIIPVIQPQGGQIEACYPGHGTLINSGHYSGQPSAAGGAQMVADMAVTGQARPGVSYKIRDWLISRQRYWGAPIPMVHCPACGIVPVPREQLPVRLPEISQFAPAGDGQSPLARATDWVNTPCPQCGAPARRETDTMDGFACSSWYFLRFPSPHYHDGPFDPAGVQYWLPVDTYVGGAEHAVMHLLYARFWTKVMHDAGLVPFSEPFRQLRNQGVLHADDGQRMSKSKGNVVTPDEVVARYGSDALRTYIIFLGPFEAGVNWTEMGIRGVTRFLDRYWQWANSSPPAGTGPTMPHDFTRRQHETIRRVTQDMAAFKFNTAVAALMEWLNYLVAVPAADLTPAGWREAVATFTLLLAPIAPFISEEVWQTVLGHRNSVHRQNWPAYDEAILVAEAVTLAVQVNGRLRGTVQVPAGADEAAVQQAALAEPNVQKHVAGRSIQQVVVVPGRVVNIVV